MAKIDGKTPEQVASEIIKDAIQETLVTISGVHNQKLAELLRYKFSKKIYSKGQLWFQNNEDSLRKEFLESVIDSMYEQRKKQDAEQEKKDRLEYYTLLISRGVDKLKALEMAEL